MLHFVAILLLLATILTLLAVGAYRASSRRKTISPPPKTPKILRSNGTSNFGPTTILISLDGFRADFLGRGLTPTLNSFIAEGVSPKYMLPSFPSLTFPNHWTIVTGLYPESHGVVGNTFWDPVLGEEFYYTDPLRSMSPKWWTSTGAEPLWSTCETQGVRSAVHMWPGSEAGIFPEPQTVDKFNGRESLGRKVSRVLGFLDRPSEYDEDVKISAAEARPQFIAMYVPNVDADGHKYGPNSTEIRSTISSVDSMLATLFSGIHARNLTDIVNIIVLSDHGMATTSTSRLIQLDDLVDPNEIEHIDGWPLYGLRPKSGVDVSALHVSLVHASEGKNFTAYLRSELPERYHFSASDRIAPLWLVPDPGWAIVQKSQFDVTSAQASGRIYAPKGLHGYDNTHPLMRAIFVARGPAFPHAKNSMLEVFQNIEVYNIICDSLDVEPRPNNGSLRLPFAPVGVHEDSPASSNEKEDMDLPGDATKTEEAEDSRPTRPADPEADDSEGADKHGEGFWGTVWDKLEDTKDWLAELWGKVSGKVKGNG